MRAGAPAQGYGTRRASNCGTCFALTGPRVATRGKQLASAPLDIRKRYEKWLDVATVSGPPGLKVIRGFNDEAPSGTWSGYRSSRLSIQYRVIYRVIPTEQLFPVLEVVPHDYRKHSPSWS
jgi:hypothetical protein